MKTKMTETQTIPYQFYNTQQTKPNAKAQIRIQVMTTQACAKATENRH